MAQYLCFRDDGDSVALSPLIPEADRRAICYTQSEFQAPLSAAEAFYVFS